MKYKIDGGFSCDRQSKYDFTASTVAFLTEWAKGKDITVIFKEEDENGALVDFDSTYSNDKCRTDLVMFYNGYPYVIELKERWGEYTSTYYGKEGDKEGWMLNIDKYNVLKSKTDAIPLYVNLYPDGQVRIWNLNKIDNFNTITKNIPTKTVVESKKKKQDRYEVWNKDAITIKRIKGSKSNGVYQN